MIIIFQMKLKFSVNHFFVLLLLIVSTSPAIFRLSAPKTVKSNARLTQYLGSGYDMARGNPQEKSRFDPGFRSPVFKFTYSQNKMTDDRRYDVPDGVFSRDTTTCSLESKTSRILGTESYQNELKTRVDVGGGYKGVFLKASFSASVEFEKIQKELTKNEQVMTHTSSQCEAYRLTTGTFKTLPLTQDFIEGVKVSYEEKDWTQFIEIYGTHFCYDIIFGGRAIQEISYNYKSVALLDSQKIDINVAAKASYAKFYGSASSSVSISEKEEKFTEQAQTSKREIYIGGQPPRNGKTSQWLTSVRSNPMPIFYQVRQISELFDEVLEGDDVEEAQKQFAKALDDYCDEVGCTSKLSDRVLKPPGLQLHENIFYGDYSKGSKFKWLPQRTTFPFTNVIKIKTIEDLLYGFVKKLELIVTDGVEVESSGYRGGDVQLPFSKNKQYVWEIPANQFITQIMICGFNKVKAPMGFTFYTNKGTVSRKMGPKASKSCTRLTVPTNYQIVGYAGSQDKSAFGLLSLSFYMVKIVYS